MTDRGADRDWRLHVRFPVQGPAWYLVLQSVDDPKTMLRLSPDDCAKNVRLIKDVLFYDGFRLSLMLERFYLMTNDAVDRLVGNVNGAGWSVLVSDDEADRLNAVVATTQDDVTFVDRLTKAKTAGQWDNWDETRKWHDDDE